MRKLLLSGLVPLLFLAGCGAPEQASEKAPNPAQARWDARFSSVGYVYGKEPVEFLAKNIGLLPRGKALDLAAGEGRNAVFLAQNGFEVDAVDISAVGLRKAEALAAERGVRIRTVAADLEDYDLGTARYDVVTNLYYLQRSLIPRIKRALKPGGMVVFEMFTVDNLAIPGAHGPKDRAWLLEPGELRRLFDDFEVLRWSETRDDKKAAASLLARKRG